MKLFKIKVESLLSIMENKGLDEAQVAQMCNCNKSTIKRILVKGNTSLETIYKLCTGLDVTFEDIVSY